jgi:hypothetical protein
MGYTLFFFAKKSLIQVILIALFKGNFLFWIFIALAILMSSSAKVYYDIENFDGLIRHYFPNMANCAEVSVYDVNKAKNQQNNRPRKRYGYKSPTEKFNLLTKIAFAD